MPHAARPLLFLALAAAACGCGCGCGCDEQEREVAAGPAGMAFAVDETQLAGGVDVAGLRVRPPRGWTALPAAQLAAVAPADADVAPLAAFVADDGSALVVTDVPRLGPDERLAAFRGVDPEAAADSFDVNGLAVRQYLLRGQGRVNFRLIADGLEADRQVQLDYAVPEAAWPARVAAVESSIGSLRRAAPEQPEQATPTP